MNRVKIRRTVPRREDDLSPELVEDFWAYMAKQYGTKVVRKSSSAKMKVIGRLLAALGVMSYGHFMRFATTLKRTIYIPFEIGVADEHWSLWDQIVVCVHEHQHVEQYLEEGSKYERRYLFRSAKRATYEAEANRSNFELFFWRYGFLPDAAERARKLKHYGCSGLDIEVTEKYLLISGETIKRGGVINRSSKLALPWLNRFAPRLAHG